MFSSFPRGCGKGDELAVLWSRLEEVEFCFCFKVFGFFIFDISLSLFYGICSFPFSLVSVLASYLWTGMRAT